MSDQVYDINKLRAGKGILRFPISLAKIDNTQTAKKYFEEYIPHITPNKIITPTVGANFCYGDWLYMHNNQPASILKKKYSVDMAKHRNASIKYINKPQIHLGQTHKDASYYIPSAFDFDSRSSLYFGYEGDFICDLNKLIKIYHSDSMFQKYIKLDCESCERNLDDNQLNFFLEEHLIMYLISHMKIKLNNEYVTHPEWILLSYPGKPLRHHIYIMQQDFFKLTSKSTNFYKNSRYDLQDKKLYDFSTIDLSLYQY